MEKNGTLARCKELGIRLIAYSPIEMGLLTGETASADVVARGEVVVRSWPFEQLRKLRNENPALWSKLQSVLGYDLIEKIRAASQIPAPVPAR